MAGGEEQSKSGCWCGNGVQTRLLPFALSTPARPPCASPSPPHSMAARKWMGQAWPQSPTETPLAHQPKSVVSPATE